MSSGGNLTKRILIGLALGIATGFTLHSYSGNTAEWAADLGLVTTIFLRLSRWSSRCCWC